MITTRIKVALLRFLDAAALSVFEPVVRLAFGEEPRTQVTKIGKFIGVPVLAFMAFIGAWHVVATNIETKFGTLPTPADTWHQARVMAAQVGEYRRAEAAFHAERRAAAEEHRAMADRFRRAAELPHNSGQRDAFLAEADARAALAASADSARFSAPPTIMHRITRSLKTVFLGFAISTAIALPVGILCGLSPVFMAAASPLIQIFKPVSPVAWVPIAMIVVASPLIMDTLVAGTGIEPSMLSSALVVAMCALWPTLVNTALGVASIDKDHINVARVLRLGWWTRLTKIVIPSSLPLIFAGLRISLGVGWMVLIAAELLVQNPGLGQFIWDRFQDNQLASFSQIFVALFVIGGIGFLLDRSMIVLQRSVSFDMAPTT
jgi:nitrate/nitrite transport system permease protein